MPSSVLAQTTATSARVPLVIHCLAPLSTQSSPTCFARGAHAAGVRAEVGLGQAEAADRLAGGEPGIQRSFCSCEPKA